MAAFPMGYKTVYKDQNLPIQSIIRQNGERPMYDSIDILGSFSSIPGLICRRFYPSYAVGDIFTKSRTQEGIAPRCLANRLRFTQGYYSNRDKFSSVWYSTGSGTNEKQLRSLDSYFGKLHDNAKLSPLDSSNQVMQVHHSKSQPISKNGLESLNDYLGKLNNGANQEPPVPSTYIEHYNEDNRAPKQLSINKETEQSYYGKQNTYVNIRRKKDEHGPNSFRDTRQQDEASSLYLIGILASINIAVFLFEIASPIRNTDLELFSLPLLYGAKINHLIVVGEWWRLVTPMFLHSGIFHMALSCWALVSFGPQVCRGYGSFTFLLIYILGGVSGNLTSFLHTPEPTVGGTGPVFAIIGAWLTYQMQNRDVGANDTTEIMFKKAIIVTALGLILSNFCPIDNWTHFGAAFTGMGYGFFTSPTLQLNDSSSGTGQEEGLKLVRQYGDSCKSLFVFTIFILALSSFLFFMEPPLNTLESINEVATDNLVYM